MRCYISTYSKLYMWPDFVHFDNIWPIMLNYAWKRIMPGKGLCPYVTYLHSMQALCLNQLKPYVYTSPCLVCIMDSIQSPSVRITQELVYLLSVASYSMSFANAQGLGTTNKSLFPLGLKRQRLWLEQSSWFATPAV